MVFLEKLSLFNINHFRKLYNKNEEITQGIKNFFDLYDKKSFIIKYLIRKQIRLFKVNDEYVGYIWYENPSYTGDRDIYSIYLKDEYINLLDSKTLSFSNINSFNFEILSNSKTSFIMRKLNFNINSNNVLMKISTSSHREELNNNNIYFKHFIEGKDEELRCYIQNIVFRSKNRIPLNVEDILREEKENYYIKNFGVFICNKLGQAIGYGQVIYINGLYTIVNVCILESYRNLGYGKLLVEYLINLCYRNSIKNVYIRVDKCNTKALNLYKKIGFIEYQNFTNWYKMIY